MIGSNPLTHSFRSHVGTESRVQDLLGDFMMRVSTSSSEAWVNLSSGVFTDEVSTSWSIPCVWSVWRSHRMFCILLIKKELNISVSSQGDHVWGRDVDHQAGDWPLCICPSDHGRRQWYDYTYKCYYLSGHYSVDEPSPTVKTDYTELNM